MWDWGLRAVPWVLELARAVLYKLTPALLGTLLSLPGRWRSSLERRERESRIIWVFGVGARARRRAGDACGLQTPNFAGQDNLYPLRTEPQRGNPEKSNFTRTPNANID